MRSFFGRPRAGFGAWMASGLGLAASFLVAAIGEATAGDALTDVRADAASLRVVGAWAGVGAGVWAGGSALARLEVVAGTGVGALRFLSFAGATGSGCAFRAGCGFGSGVVALARPAVAALVAFRPASTSCSLGGVSLPFLFISPFILRRLLST
jgi:hypothetical protein